jgi:hypothetical protein
MLEFIRLGGLIGSNNNRSRGTNRSRKAAMNVETLEGRELLSHLHLGHSSLKLNGLQFGNKSAPFLMTPYSHQNSHPSKLPSSGTNNPWTYPSLNIVVSGQSSFSYQTTYPGLLVQPPQSTIVNIGLNSGSKARSNWGPLLNVMIRTQNPTTITINPGPLASLASTTPAQNNPIIYITPPPTSQWGPALQ